LGLLHNQDETLVEELLTLLTVVPFLLAWRYSAQSMIFVSFLHEKTTAGAGGDNCSLSLLIGGVGGGGGGGGGSGSGDVDLGDKNGGTTTGAHWTPHSHVGSPLTTSTDSNTTVVELGGSVGEHAGRGPSMNKSHTSALVFGSRHNGWESTDVTIQQHVRGGRSDGCASAFIASSHIFVVCLFSILLKRLACGCCALRLDPPSTGGARGHPFHTIEHGAGVSICSKALNE
jgi:hypothetical protein